MKATMAFAVVMVAYAAFKTHKGAGARRVEIRVELSGVKRSGGEYERHCCHGNGYGNEARIV